jgi:hypothetical protein
MASQIAHGLGNHLAAWFERADRAGNRTMAALIAAFSKGSLSGVNGFAILTLLNYQETNLSKSGYFTWIDVRRY